MKVQSGFYSLLLVFALIWVSVASPTAPALVAAGDGLDAEKAKGEELVTTLRLQDALGPLAPVALSPFFALTCLSGASLLADTGILPAAISKNALLSGNSVLNNGFVFAGLLALTLITAVPKLTKVTKPFAQAVDQIEAYSGIIAVIAVQFLSQVSLGEPEAAKVAVVYQAGVVSFSMTTVIAAFSAINIFVVNTVKFFVEVMIFLSPFPAVDAAFEAANKAVAGFLLGIYFWSPWVAMLLNLLIFAVCLLIFAWIYRRVVYMRSVLGDPIMGWLAERLFRRPRATVVSTPLPKRVASQCPDRQLVLKAFAGRGYQSFKRKGRGYLVQSAGRLRFVAARFLRASLIVDLPGEGHRIQVDDGLLSNTIRFEDQTGDVVMKVVFTRRYNELLPEIRRLLGARVADEREGQAPGMNAVRDSRAVGAAIKTGGRDAVRAELA